MDLRRQHLIRLVISTIGLAALVLAFAKLGSSRPQAATGPAVVRQDSLTPTEPVTPPAAPQVSASPPTAIDPVPSAANQRDAELRAQLVGYWTHVENGQQWIENRADGTSRMLLKLDFVASLLYGQESSMQLNWEVQDGTLTHTVLSGTPQKNVDAITRDYGKVRKYTILETTPDRMLLEAQNEKKERELWTRTQPPKEWQ